MIRAPFRCDFVSHWGGPVYFLLAQSGKKLFIVGTLSFRFRHAEHINLDGSLGAAVDVCPECRRRTVFSFGDLCLGCFRKTKLIRWRQRTALTNALQ
jgi:hypothetical protein